MLTNHPIQDTNIVQYAFLLLWTISYQNDDVSVEYFPSQTRGFTQIKKHQKQNRKTVQLLIFFNFNNYAFEPLCRLC